MLVLTRQIGESIVIDKDIYIRVLQVDGGQVRIGIDAPVNKSIYREELYRDIQNENKEASELNSDAVQSFTQQLKQNVQFHGPKKETIENE